MKNSLTMPSPWVSSLPANLSIDLVKKLSERKARPINNIDLLSRAQIIDDIENRLAEIYVATNQRCSIILDLCEIVRTHYSTNYPSQCIYGERVNYPENHEQLLDGKPILFTGQAGSGKTETIKALARVLKSTDVVIDDKESVVSTNPVLHIRLAKASAQKNLIAEALRILVGKAVLKGVTISAMQNELRRSFYNAGVGFFILDELQFLSKSEGSLQNATSLMIDSLTLGAPVIFCTNYSLGHKLLTRSTEEKQRLITNVIELLPENPDSTDWEEIVSEAIAVAPEIFEINPTEDAMQLYQWTAGLGRMLRQLLVIALRASDKSKHFLINMAELKRAYLSSSYVSNRIDVEFILRSAVDRSIWKDRKDLCSPFPGNDLRYRLKESLKASHQQRASEAAAISALPINTQQKILSKERESHSATVLPIKPKGRKGLDVLKSNTLAAIENVGLIKY